jgi:hypothetical protein
MEMKGVGTQRVARVIRSLMWHMYNYGVPWYGSLAWYVPAGQSVTGITGE